VLIEASVLVGTFSGVATDKLRGQLIPLSVYRRKTQWLSAAAESRPKVPSWPSAETERSPKQYTSLLSAPKPKPNFGRSLNDGVVQQPPLPQQTFFQLLHIMDLRTVDPLLKHTPDAVANRIQIWRIGWPHDWRDKLLASLSAAWWQCHVHGERHYFSDVNITSPGKGCTWHAT